MQPRHPLRFTKSISSLKTTTSSSSSASWRARIKDHQLVHQISSILLQRHNWVSLLRNLNLSSKLTPSLFFQVLQNTRYHPRISLNFFNWVRTHLGFEPDLKSHCFVIRTAIGSSEALRVRTILDSLIRTHSASRVAESMIRACRGTDSDCDALSLVLECYSEKGLLEDGVQVFRDFRFHGIIPPVSTFHKMLAALQKKNDITLAWCFYGAMVRSGFTSDQNTWSLVAEMLYKMGKVERVVRLLDVGIYSSEIFDIVIHFCSKSGDFGAAFERLSEMYALGLDPSFNAYSSVLDGACRYKDTDVIERVMRLMVEKGLLPRCELSLNDSIIQKLCDLGKTYAAEMYFKRACDGKVKFGHGTYGCMLRALAIGGRLDEAMEAYHVITRTGIMVDDSYYNAFVVLLCKVDYSTERHEVLKDILERGHKPCSSELSGYIASQCGRRRWREAEEVLDLSLGKGLLPDPSACSLLVKRYCSTRQIGKAVMLHNEMKKLKGSFDVTVYHALLHRLWEDGRVEEALRVFDDLKQVKVVTAASFTIMVRGLCRVKEMRKAMKLHDEMLSMGLKPDKKTYKRLILEFRD